MTKWMNNPLFTSDNSSGYELNAGLNRRSLPYISVPPPPALQRFPPPPVLRFGSKQIQKHSAAAKVLLEWLNGSFQAAYCSFTNVLPWFFLWALSPIWNGERGFCVRDISTGKKQNNNKRLWFSSHNSAPMWNKWMMSNRTLNTGSCKVAWS